MTIMVRVGDDIGFEFNNSKIHKISFDNYKEIMELSNFIDIALHELNSRKEHMTDDK